jgi:hypothetical protein
MMTDAEGNGKSLTGGLTPDEEEAQEDDRDTHHES